ncbi:MAG: phospho-N-acetylmuramoyl-pentapeptide-transferase [Ruminococcaceae bacterium]|nr:phospho-N-acetylmuramoyl-pentapeptide-transferase [Oscillospiraceae bacterium]
MKEILIAFIVAFAVSAAVGPFVIKTLRRLKFGQKILEDGPKWHLKKQNIATMGGFIFFFGIVAAMLVALLLTKGEDALRWLIVLAMATAYGAIGFIDDWHKIKKSQNKGLSAKQKFLLQLAVAIVFITLLRVCGMLTNVIVVPFLNVSFEVPWILYFIFMSFVIVGADNAVNLTDGLDGLAASVTFVVMVFFTAAALYLAEGTLAILPAAAAGALLGFLIYNFNPARVFMGDTGSLFLGGLVAGLAFAIDLPLILLPVGLVYIVEVLSVILQVGYFKLTHGKRLFKMSPIHHHFELCGYNERQIVITASLITALFCVLGYFGVRWL